MTKQQFMQKLNPPTKRVDVILDTDAFNEIDDQFAIAYLLKSNNLLNTVGIVAAPFFNGKVSTIKQGMEKSYDEIKKIIALGEFDGDIPVLKGSDKFLPDQSTPIYSSGCDFIINTALKYTPENPLYILAIGAITDVASALLIKPEITNRVVIVWLGGHSYGHKDTLEFNMRQDIFAARIVMGSGAPFVQLPCVGVVSELRLSEQDLRFWLCGKNKLSDYLATNAINEANSYALNTPWTRVIWDVSAVAWLLNKDGKFMQSRVVNVRLPDFEGGYEKETENLLMSYVYYINRDKIVADLVKALTE